MSKTETAVGSLVALVFIFFILRGNAQAQPPAPAWQVGDSIFCHIPESGQFIHWITAASWDGTDWQYELSLDDPGGMIYVAIYSETALLGLECVIAA